METAKSPGDAYCRKEIEIENLVAPIHDKHFYYPPLIRRVKESRASEIAAKVGGRMLDVGCGTGIFLRRIREKNPDVKLYGADISDGMIREAGRLLPPDVHLNVADACRLPYSDGMFDLILMAALLHHIKDRKSVLEEARRVLKRGGKIIVLDPRKTNSIPLKFLHVLFYPLQFFCRIKNRGKILLRAGELRRTGELVHHGPYDESELDGFDIEYINPLNTHFEGLLFPGSRADSAIAWFIFWMDRIIGKAVKGYGIRATFTES